MCCFLFLLSFGPRLGSAQGPLLPCTFEQPHGEAVFEQRFDLWIRGTQAWTLCLECPREITLRDDLWQGQGSCFESRLLKVHFDLGLLGPGRHERSLGLVLEGAQGILGLPCPECYWILPLNCCEVSVERDGGARIALPSGSWFLLEAEDRIFFKGERLFLEEESAGPGPAVSMQQAAPLSWAAANLSLEAGDQREVALNIRGPAPAGQLVLSGEPEFRFAESWCLNGAELAVEKCGGCRLILNLPELGPGEHQIRGFLQALLPAQAGQFVLSAVFQGFRQELKVEIRRSFFDNFGIQIIPTAGLQGMQAPFLMPDGTIRHGAEEGKIAVETKGLQVLIPLQDPSRPIWVGLPWAESIPTQPLDSKGGPPSSFVLPILVWDQGPKWRLVMRSENWLLDLSPQLRRLQGCVGPVFIEGSGDSLVLTCRDSYYSQADGWLWREGPWGLRGTWSSKGWLCTMHLPRGAEQRPEISLRYQGDQWQVLFAPGDLLLSLNRRGWLCELRTGSKSLRLQSPSGRWNFKASLDKLAIDWDKDAGQKWLLQADRRGNWSFRLKSESWEAYGRGRGRNGEEAGLRLKIPRFQDPYFSLTRLAVQAKNGLVLAELAHRLDYRYSPKLSFYLEGSVQSSQGKGGGAAVHFGAGLVFMPIPQLAADLSWSAGKGWQCRAGLVIPLVGEAGK